jgi:hypothetical protein
VCVPLDNKSPIQGVLKLQTDGRVISRWYAHSDAQQALFNDCLAQKANLAAKPDAKGQPRVSR